MLAFVSGEAEAQLELLKLVKHGTGELLSQHVHICNLFAF